MRLNVYRSGTTYSLRDSFEADMLVLEVPDGTEVLPFGLLGLVAFVPTEPGIRAMMQPKDLLLKAYDRHRGFRLIDELNAHQRQLRERADTLRKNLTVRATARQLGASVQRATRRIG